MQITMLWKRYNNNENIKKKSNYKTSTDLEWRIIRTIMWALD